MKASHSNSQTLVFKTNINCSGCVAKVTPILNDIPAIESWQVDTGSKDKILTVQADDSSRATVEQNVKAAGFNIESIK